MEKKKVSIMQVLFHFAPMIIPFSKVIGLKQELFAYKYLKCFFLKYHDNFEYEEKALSKDVILNKTIWIYWRQGIESAPNLVKKCIESIKKNAGDYNVIILDENNLNKYISLPSFIEEKHLKGLIKEAHYSDLLRISLLIQYGGIWCDSTCYMTGPFPDYVINSDFFMFQNTKLKEWVSPSKCSNWFIKSNSHNTILEKLRNVLFHYWEQKSEPCHYFLFHLTLSLLTEEICEIGRLWDKIPYVCNMNPHVFQFSFELPYDNHLYSFILKSCFIHKLTYKLNRIRYNPNSCLSHFLNT